MQYREYIYHQDKSFTKWRHPLVKDNTKPTGGLDGTNRSTHNLGLAEICSSYAGYARAALKKYQMPGKHATTYFPEFRLPQLAAGPRLVLAKTQHSGQASSLFQTQELRVLTK